MHTPFHRRSIYLISCISLLFVSFISIKLIGYGENSLWTRSAVLNWNDFGFVALQGKLVTNPGGYGVLTDPHIYKGHSPVSFYPIYLTVKLLGWLGNGFLIFHVLFSLTMLISIKVLLGEFRLAWIVAWAACLCPGYSIYPTIIDPNATAIYSIFPLSAVVIRILSKDKITISQIAALAACIFFYTSLNWSTALGHGILFCTLLVLPKVSRKGVAIYTALAGLSVAGIAGIAVFEKLNSVSGTPDSGGLLSMLANYTWGNIGYGAHMSTVKALVRLSVVMGVGMLPLLMLVAWLFFKGRDFKPRLDFIALFPICAASLCVIGMRNYFGMHSWMSGPMFLSGLVFSLYALLARNAQSQNKSIPAFRGLGFLAACLGYALLVLGAHRIYHAEALEFTALVGEQSARTDHIVLVEALDPDMSQKAGAVSEGCDRHVVVLKNLNSPLPGTGNYFLLSSVHLDDQLPLVARSDKSKLASLPIIRSLLEWYARHVARRTPQERHFDYTTGASFGLYRLQSANP